MAGKTRRLTVVEYVNTSVLAFGLAAMSTSLGQIILPLRVLDLVPETLKNTYLGILTFIGMAAAMAVQPLVGWLSDKTTLSWGRRRPYIAVGSVLATVLMAGIGIASNFVWLVVASVLVQLCANMAQTPYDAIVKDRVPQSQRGQVSSIRAIAGAAGAVMLLVATGFLMDRHEVRERDIWLWLSLALPAIVMALTTLWTVFAVEDEWVPATPKGADAAKRPPEPKTPKRVYMLLGAAFSFTLAGGILQTYTLFFLKDVVKIDNPASGVGILGIAVGITIIVTLYPAGLLSDKFGRRTLLFVSAALGSGGSLLFLLAQSLTHVVLIGIILGVAVGIFMAAGRALITDMVSENRAAQQMGLANFALIGGLAVSKLGGGAVDFLNGFSDNLGYYTLLVVCAGAFLMGAFFINLLNPQPVAEAAATSSDDAGGDE